MGVLLLIGFIAVAIIVGVVGGAVGGYVASYILEPKIASQLSDFAVTIVGGKKAYGDPTRPVGRVWNSAALDGR